jgi:hypothetical protein
MKAQRAVIAASFLIVAAIWVAVIWRGPQTDADRPQLPFLGSPPPTAAPLATPDPSAGLGPQQAGRSAPAAGVSNARTATADAEDLQEGDVEDEPQPASNSPASPQPGTVAAIPSATPIIPLPSLPVPLPTGLR